MKATIFLLDRMGQFNPDYVAKAIKRVNASDEKALIKHLRQLQAGYADCGRTRILKGTHKSGKKYIVAENEADFLHSALIDNE